MRVLAIDPGTTVSGWVFYDSDSRKVLRSGVDPNNNIVKWLPCTVSDPHADLFAIERFASMGMTVGQEVFDTCVWVGRFQQCWHSPAAAHLVFRRDVKLHLCGDSRAKDPNIRQALIDKLGKPGTKKEPGPTYGVASHAWSALAVAVTAFHQVKKEIPW